jgi:hypothetical protein
MQIIIMLTVEINLLLVKKLEMWKNMMGLKKYKKALKFQNSQAFFKKEVNLNSKRAQF